MSNSAIPGIARHMFPPHPTSARAARQFVAGELAGRSSDEARDTACLLTSELVTNAVIHARTDVEVSVRRSNGRLRIEVSDHTSRRPTLMSIPADSTTGRGLLLVEVMSATWGIDDDNSGKLVWFELAAR